MRIVQLTPGTGNFHCGTCLRDHAVVNAMRKRGHDVTMAPLYLPFVTDGTDSGDVSQVFFGGVNVYLEQKFGLFRKTPRWLDRVFNAPFILKFASRFAGSTDSRQLGDMTMSMLRGEEGTQAKELDTLIDWLKTQPKPDVICLSNVLLIGLARRLKRDLGCKLVCMLQAEDSFLNSLPEPHRTDAWRETTERCREVDAFIPTSQYYGDLMAKRLKLPAERVHVVHNGIDLTGFAAADAPPDPPVLGFMARMTPPKGLHHIVDAFITLKNNDRVPGLRLRVAGALTDADKKYVKQQQAKLAKAGVADDATFEANISRERKLEMLRSLSVLSVPATYGESFGLYMLEAWASGVPVVQPRNGAYPELIEATGGGVLCDPDNADALATAIEVLLLKPDDARRLGDAGRAAVIERFHIDAMVEKLCGVFEKVCGGEESGAAEIADERTNKAEAIAERM